YDFDNLWRFQNTVHDESIKILHPCGIFWFSLFPFYQCCIPTGLESGNLV
ncbi:hypothetical protein DYADSP32_5415, partial [Dyadobacter sp. 32]